MVADYCLDEPGCSVCLKGMRAVLNTSAEPIAHLGWATGLNLLFLCMVIAAFHWTV